MRPLNAMSPRRVRAGPGTRGLSGTDRKIQVATPSASTHRTQKTPRQPNAGSIAWTGDVVSALPSAPIAVAMPVTYATRPRSNQSACALISAIRPAEIPMPRTIRAAASPAKPGDSANIAKPIAASNISTACTRRAPNASSATPSGSCAAA